jgi:hypothetical protein
VILADAEGSGEVREVVHRSARRGKCRVIHLRWPVAGLVLDMAAATNRELSCGTPSIAAQVRERRRNRVDPQRFTVE